MKRIHILGALAGLATLTACSEPEVILPGERLALRDGQEVRLSEVNVARPIALAAQVNHAEWPQRGGSATHRLQHPAFAAVPQLYWSAPIGTGEGRQFRITADPVVAANRVFTLDARATVTATGLDGSTLWSRDLTPPGERTPRASGGALAYGEGRLYVTTGYGRLVALDPATGAEIWTQRFAAPVTAAPTIAGGTVYVVAADNTAWALDAANGRERWQLSGTPTTAAFVGGPAPAVTDRVALLPYSSGELVAVLRNSGSRLWGTTVAGSRPGRAWAGVTDITGDPVVQGETVFVGNASGRVMALDLATGAQRWAAREGAYGPVWPAGDSLFLVSDEGQLVRLDASSGARIWAADLPYFTDTRERRRNEIVAHYGPVLAGGRLWLAGNDGMLRAFDPVAGGLVTEVAIPGGAAANPVVVNGTMYVVGGNGQLHAFR
ncbi:PQQ-binding-like beta-propeller repeat protein [Plastorhodobacter daqingensis]|uniref:PQQ-binding-like beta-propeller repeat protein n=1 Tax=Plastorhodobacter daqingensis TaxID=1387281 RepID=A0ABW2ULX2_9RHOB